MPHVLAFVTAGLTIASAAVPVVAQGSGVASIEQIGAARSSATVQNSASDKVPPLVSAKILAACEQAQAADRAAPAGVDCVKALQVAAKKIMPTAEGSLLTLFGGNADVSGAASTTGGGSASADQVSRQLSSGGFQGTAGSDAAASVARDRAPPPASTPPPR